MTSAYSSYSGCRQYRENLADAVAEVGAGAPRLDRLRHYFNHPGFVEPMVDATLAALAELPATTPAATRTSLFVTHSIPIVHERHQRARAAAPTSPSTGPSPPRSSSGSAQETGHRYAAELVFCSRSGPPHVPWLEPDVNDHLERAGASRACRGVVVVPIGFVSDHMEVIYDLDTEAQATAEETRAAVRPGRHRRGRPALRGDGARPARSSARAVERGGRPRARRRSARSGPSWDVCPAGCCPNPRGATSRRSAAQD